MSKFFDELEGQLHSAARAQTDDRPTGAEQPPRPRRRLRSWDRAIPVALTVAVTVGVVAGIGLTLHATNRRSAATSRPSRPVGHPRARGAVVYSGGGGMQVLGTLGHLSVEQQHELSTYIVAAQIKASRTPACAGPQRPTLSEGKPSRELLSLLGVLRRSATPADLPRVPFSSEPLYPIGARGVYVRYVRRALVKDGVSYYVIPAASTFVDPRLTARCRANEVAILRSEAPRIPASERSSTLALQARWLALFARETQPSGGAVCFSDFAASGAGGGTCSSAAAIERNGEMQSDGSTLSGVVPDGVASVTLYYPATHGVSALTVTADVTDNVFAALVSRIANGGSWPPTVMWRSATGRVIKTIATR